MADPAFIPQIAQIVPDYELLRRIGGGSYGEVFLARSKATGVLRAAKIVWRRSFEDERPFQREFEGLQRFERISREHPSQLSLFHIGRDDAEGCFYYVMELADAMQPGWDAESYTPRTLRAELAQRRLAAEETLEIGVVLTEALGRLHRHGLIHRDVKPSNVIFVNGRPKLADIGLVTEASDTRSIVGTEGYLPPEGPGAAQADIFALGKVLYEAATGLDRREFPRLPPDLRSWSDSQGVFEMNEIALKACAHDPNERYATCEEIQADLRLLDQGQSVIEKRAAARRGALARRALLTGAGMIALVVAAFLLWRHMGPSPPSSKNPEALRLYREALYYTKSDTLARRLETYTNLSQAIKLDPGFVDAYYAMFEAYFDSFVGDRMPPYYNTAANFRAVAEKLRQIAPHSAQFHTANSIVMQSDWKFDEAMAEAALAIKIDPNFLRAHSTYAYCICLARGDAGLALRELRIAERIDPTDPYVQTTKSIAYATERRFDLAIEQCCKIMDLEPRTTQLHLNLGCLYESNHQYDKALDEFEQFDLLNGTEPSQAKAWRQKLRSCLHHGGPQAMWRAELDRDGDNARGSAYSAATLHARLGETNEAFRLLNLAHQQRDGWMAFLLIDDAFDSLHDDPRFQELVKKMGLRPIAGAL
ncbi:MAG TPA: protein kinase [Verrucomicrobiae bacterium]|jgi:serine/threonine protein kinase|nr:protein kinase [Verrucomicrobiae bacterium]